MKNSETLLGKAEGTVRDALNRLFLLPKLKDSSVLSRFNEISGDYLKLRDVLAGVPSQAGVNANPGYGWNSWADNIRETFKTGVPLDFLSTPIIANTMVFGRRRGKARADDRIAQVREIYKDAAAGLLREDLPGGPNVTDADWLTSANRAHQAYHLAFYKKVVGTEFASASTVLEWGAGYGNMARLVKRLNPGVTYIIVDLPELMPLQYIYLHSILGPSALNPVCGVSGIEEGKINFVPYSAVMEKRVNLRCDGFISTWAITESPLEAQDLVIGDKCFGAKQILVAYAKGDGNKFEPRLGELSLNEVPAALQPGHAYAIK